MYCIQPLAAAGSGALPTTMNVSFWIDDDTSGTFVHRGSQSATAFATNVTVFAKEGLPETAHVLRVQLQPNSVFIFDHLMYTRTLPSVVTTTAVTPGQSGIAASTSPTSNTDE